MLEDGTKVRVHYKARLDNGEIIENSAKTGVPFSFVIGSGEALPAFEDVVRGLQVGEHAELRVPAAQAYGERRDDLIDPIDKKLVKRVDELPVGRYIEVVTPSGPVKVGVHHIDEENVYFDYNHPYAGQDITYTVELIEMHLPDEPI